ncbi:TetR/AcrR family transcriptional regulator [Microbacterium horticulturae]|uniref:TetR/AcrR family transcriptional regulator n=1 Tax=Microbacterium horticulturae TaxID=3028316 RepID=A0ABY8BYM4_9MICO|nr:TetR/AcrR family transcriptional regulator [Microbacterium sp. KACC 23027]WEG08212.1 TetR/AcrR family transcriptional regulator [Microbacterium sp. KACC 23027]
MPNTGQGRRGSYAKGVAKREEILTRALDVIAREGYRGASVKELAAAVGLSQAGLLHYFDSKEELFTEILRKRDEIDTSAFGDLDALPADVNGVRAGYLQVIRHNSEVPGVVELFSRLSVEAADPQHPAHRFFVERNAALRTVFARVLQQAQDAGRITDAIDPDTLARIVQAVADGLQLQWMLEPDVDMARTVDALFRALGDRQASADAREDDDHD